MAEEVFDVMRKMEEAMPGELQGLVFAVSHQRPPVVTLCGSTRFWTTFQEASLMFTLMENVVLSVGAATASDTEHGISEEMKDRLDALHLSKIMMSNFVFVLNVDGYIGRSTAREICFAAATNVPVFYHERDKVPTPDYTLAKAKGLTEEQALERCEGIRFNDCSFEEYPWDGLLYHDFGIKR